MCFEVKRHMVNKYCPVNTNGKLNLRKPRFRYDKCLQVSLKRVHAENALSSML